MFEEDNCCKRTKRCCVDVIVFILGLLFTFVIGIIIGVETAIFETLGLGAFVVLAVLIGILIIIRIIMLICCKRRC